MKLILQLFIFVSLSFGVVYAQDLKEVATIRLKKDEQKKILVEYKEHKKLFKFRWTLYQNGGLVIHRSYDRIVAQNILYQRHKNRSFRLDLMPTGTKYYRAPYFLVVFKEFDYETNEAIFKIFLSDAELQIILKNLENS